MNAEAEGVLGFRPPEGAATRIDPGWSRALPLIAAAIIAILAIHWSTAESIVAIWERSDTFAHGFLIVPITLYLVWQRRRRIAAIRPRADWLGFAMLATAGAVWLIAYAGEVLVVKQLALVASLCAAVVAILGREVALALLFPLTFLFLGVPIGEALIPPLMDWTADFTVTALRLSGIPVFKEGTFFSIPSGSWSVVEGCSGLRYLIASFTVGVLFAYLSYRKWWKRVLFALTSIIVPIIANGFRAYMIVMIAHLSDNRLAHGVDHFLYGWVFFGLVMLLVFWIGSFWRDVDTDDDSPADRTLEQHGARRTNLAGCTVLAVILAAAWPVYAHYLDRDAGTAADAPALAAPVGVSGWVADAAPLTEWRPRYDPAAATLFQTYRKGDRLVGLHLRYYPHQARGEQLISSGNIMVHQKDPVWGNVGESRTSVDAGSGPIEVRETRLRSSRERLLVWDWDRIAGHDVANPYVAKILLAWQKLADQGDSGTAIMIVAPYGDTDAPPVATMQAFVRDMMPSITAALASPANMTVKLR